MNAFSVSETLSGPHRAEVQPVIERGGLMMGLISLGTLAMAHKHRGMVVNSTSALGVLVSLESDPTLIGRKLPVPRNNLKDLDRFRGLNVQHVMLWHETRFALDPQYPTGKTLTTAEVRDLVGNAPVPARAARRAETFGHLAAKAVSAVTYTSVKSVGSAGVAAAAMSALAMKGCMEGASSTSAAVNRRSAIVAARQKVASERKLEQRAAERRGELALLDPIVVGFVQDSSNPNVFAMVKLTEWFW
jgi:hypothetical protein